MRTVQPIRSKRVIEKIKGYLAQTNTRDYCLFVLGVNTALRVGDIIKLTRGDLMKGSLVRSHLRIRIGKTQREQRIALNVNVVRAIKAYIATVDMRDYQPFFPGRNPNVGMSRTNAWKILRKIAVKFDLEDFGFHSLRKSFGYHARKAGVDLSIISEKLGHSSLAVTRRYIGITNDEVNEIELAICL